MTPCCAFHPKSRSNTMADQLPTEIIFNIILRSEIKTIIRCTSVCKSWYSLIKNPTFITSHISFSSNTYHHGYILFGYSKFCYLICDTSFKLMHTIQTPFPVSPDPKFSLNFVGSCNGLLCLAPGLKHNFGKDVYIWNPIIRKHKKLPLSRYSDMFMDEKLMFFRVWFGFHEPTNDYKVVRLIYLIKNGYLGSLYVAPLVEVYSLRSNSWKIVRNDVPLMVSQNVVAFQKGVFYWRGFKGIRPCMMSFNLDNEMFSEIEQPLLDSPCSLLAVKGSSDSLFAVYSKSYGGHSGVLELWKMGENGRGWMKAYMIQCNRGVGWTIGFTRSNKFLYATLEESLVSFDLESLKTEFHDVGIPFNRFAIDVNYMESLLLLDH